MHWPNLIRTSPGDRGTRLASICHGPRRRRRAQVHIAMLSTPFLPVPPPRYGGTELIVAELVDGLRALGHRVTLYTVGGGPEHRGHALRDGARVRRAEPAWPPNPYHELDHAAWAIADLLA